MRTLVCVLALCCLAPPVEARDDSSFRADYRSEAGGSIEIGLIGFSDLVRSKATSLGEAELARLSGYLRDDLERALIDANWHGVAARETVLTVTILDVVPNRPTMQQIQDMAGAHYTSHADGGAALSAVLRDADGTLIATFNYVWFNPDSGAGDGYGVWTDTRQAFDQFAGALASSLGVAPMPRS
ncbi:hypothetical protein [Maricaulis sp. W15]|uniref:hypothetical protein n=1 Tax=Maricaulis sp. W15 TaxID=1772333 RepID=UPI000B2909A3|nr:hypothetical protein [Maricaulis sp. W15]